MMFLSLLAGLLLCLCSCSANPNRIPSNAKIIPSKYFKGVHLKYKQTGLCEDPADARNFAGYVSIPAGYLERFGIRQPLPVNTFFWYFESRKSPKQAPITIHSRLTTDLRSILEATNQCIVNGGPGAAASMSIKREVSFNGCTNIDS